jgi:hypothetical protein
MPESQWKLGGVAGQPRGWLPDSPSPLTYSIKSMEAPLDLYLRILTVEFRCTTLFS